MLTKCNEQSKDVVVFWGSQSGTAESLANRLVRDLRSRFGLEGLSADLSDYDPATIASIPETKIAIFLLSTYGEGDPSDNTAQFFSWLSKNNTAKFSQLRYAAFGLGNSKYKFYNRVVDVVAEALDRFEAKPLLPTGKADDANGATEEDFNDWKQSLFLVLHDDLKFEERPAQYEPAFQVVEDPSLDLIDLHIGEPVKPRNKGKAATSSSPIHPLDVKLARNLFTTTDRNCLHVELDITEHTELKYKTGDHLAIWPANPVSEVSRLLQVLGLQDRKDIPLLISSLDPSIQTKVPSPTTLEVLFKYYLEICAPVPRETLLSIAQFVTSTNSKERLAYLGGNREAYHSFCSTTHVTLGRLLESVLAPEDSFFHLPMSFILEILPCLSPRYYSISSSSIVSPRRISITVATSTVNSHNLPIPGLTTNYLSSFEESRRNSPVQEVQTTYDLAGPNNILQGNRVFAHVQTSKFKLPILPRHSVIMIAAGSGMAPFRGFLQERARLAKMGREVGPTKLFFGCRSAEDDYLYQDELEELKASLGSSMEVVTAFSRAEKNKNGGKMYVQDRIVEREEEVIRLLTEKNAYFYICGSASMARDVAKELGQCLVKRLGWGENQLREWSEQMKRSRRWQEDVWG
jgi:NADPH-ferrihemoprotein reductase